MACSTDAVVQGLGGQIAARIN